MTIRSETYLRDLVDSLPGWIWGARLDGSIEYFSAAGLTYAGVTEETLGTWSWVAALHPDDRDRSEKRVRGRICWKSRSWRSRREFVVTTANTPGCGFAPPSCATPKAAPFAGPGSAVEAADVAQAEGDRGATRRGSPCSRPPGAGDPRGSVRCLGVRHAGRQHRHREVELLQYLGGARLRPE
jgi:hypothetical protein